MLRRTDLYDYRLPGSDSREVLNLHAGVEIIKPKVECIITSIFLHIIHYWAAT